MVKCWPPNGAELLPGISNQVVMAPWGLDEINTAPRWLLEAQEWFRGPQGSSMGPPENPWGAQGIQEGSREIQESAKIAPEGFRAGQENDKFLGAPGWVHSEAFGWLPGDLGVSWGGVVGRLGSQVIAKWCKHTRWPPKRVQVGGVSPKAGQG